MIFEEALKRIKLGAKLHRKTWEDKNGFVGYFITLEKNENKEYLAWNTAAIGKEKWYATSDELLASDWVDPAE